MEWALLAKRVMPGLVPGIHVFAAPRQERLSWPGRSPAMTRKRLGRNMIAARPAASWFETRGVAALLTMRVSDLILRSTAKRCVSKDEATAAEFSTSPSPRKLAVAAAFLMSSPRKRGPPRERLRSSRRRAAYFERRCSTAFARSPVPVVMGPRFRGDDRLRNARFHTRDIAWQR